MDGIRALSILAVLFSHLAGTSGAYRPWPFMGALASLGVHVFFILSGYLITFLLLQEHKRTGAISLRGFYRRRILRIFPAFYAYLLAIALLKTAGFLHLPWSDLATSAGFLTDLRTTGWDVGHFWSLSVQEQFYFFWPALLSFAGRISAVRAALTAMLVTPLLSGILWNLNFPHLAGVSISMNAIATGCVFAGVRERLHTNASYMNVLQSRWVGLLTLVPLLFVLWHGRGVVLLNGITAACVAVLIDRVITVRCGFAAFLDWRPMVWLGTMSYSLYVWQQMFLNRNVDRALSTFPLNLILAFSCALLSFYFIERPFLFLKKQTVRPAMEAAATLAPSR